MVKISIIMPIYNAEIYLEESVNSILNQNFEDFELICIDDGSTDNSLAILNEISKKDSRLRVISQKNLGAGAARNKGIKESLGEYICFIDSDDYVIPEYLEIAYDNITSNNSDIVFYKIGNIKNNKKVDLKPYFAFEKIFEDVDFNNYTFNCYQIREYVFNFYFAPWTKLYRKELLNRYDDFHFVENLPYEDILFHVKTMLRAEKISFVPERLYYYRIDNENSATFDSSTHKEIYKIIDLVEKFLKENNYYEEFKYEYEFFKTHQILYYLGTHVEEEDFKIAKTYLKDIDIDNNPILWEKRWIRRRKKYKVFFDAENAETYNENIKIHNLKVKHDNLKRKNKKLKRENKKLNKKRNREKKKNKELLSSKSWKITKPFRSISQRVKGDPNEDFNLGNSMKGFVLNKSGSYNYYRKNYEKTLKENKKLNKKLREYEKIYPPKECPICGYKGIDFKPYPQIIHKEVECPKCRSHERHRALWLYFQKNEHLLKEGNKFLHFAPEPQFYELFKSKGMEYHRADISKENWWIDEIIDIQNIPYEDNYFDLIYCSHILEHVPDDRKAMKELYRVLKPGGTTLILVPINGIAFELPYDENKTLEDERINTDELREKYYGQFDHVRLYGKDFKQRLIESGFTVSSDDFIKKLGFETVERYALIRDENIFECTK